MAHSNIYVCKCGKRYYTNNMNVGAGPSRINAESEYEDSDDEDDTPMDVQTEKTDLDDFLENYKASPDCLLQILSYLDFDECGYTRLENPQEDPYANYPTAKRIYPAEGFCIRTITLEESVVYINICHCDDIQAPSNALLDTLLNMTNDNPPIVNLPLSIGRPHRERDYDGSICIAFDIILNSVFYEQQVNKYELLRAYILSLCITGINDKYLNSIQADTCVKLDEPYYGTMPRQYIDRRLSAFEEDQLMVREYTQTKAARIVKWAKANALKRLQKLHNYERRTARTFRAPMRLRDRVKAASYMDCQPSTSGMRTRSYRSPSPPPQPPPPPSPPPQPRTSNLMALFPRIQMDEIDLLRGMECLDMDGIVRIGIHVESDHLPYPTVIPPGSMDDSVDILNSLEYDDLGYNLDYELFQLCDDDRMEYVAITDLPYETNLEDIAIFASRDGLIVCDRDARRYLEISLPYPILPKRIKITVNRLNMTIYMPVVPLETSSEPEEEDQEVPNLSD